MLIAADDFRIKSENFDLTNGWNVLRIMCGAFMFPACCWQVRGGRALRGTVGFFAKAGFQPPELWVYLAAAAETLSGVCLVLGICTRYAAVGAAAVLGVAVYACRWSRVSAGRGIPVAMSTRCSGRS